MDNLLSEGLTLMVYGMGFVFLFLTLLIGVTTLMSKLVMKYEPAPQPKTSSPNKGAAPVVSQSGNDELIAVIAAAVHKYRS